MCGGHVIHMAREFVADATVMQYRMPSQHFPLHHRIEACMVQICNTTPYKFLST